MVLATPGLVKLRKHQFGRQTTFGTPVAAKRAYPFGGTPDINLNWTDPEGDMGSLDPIAPPTRGAEDLTASLTADRLYYNDLPIQLAGILGGDVDAVGAGTSKVWTYEVEGPTANDLDLFTYEFGDDSDGSGSTENDWFQLGDGLLESVTFNAPEGLGALSSDMSWRFGSAAYEGATEAALQPSPAVPTAALSVDSSGVPVYLGHAVLSIDSAFGDIGTTPIADALYSFNLSISHELDQKRLANGTGFGLTGYSRTTRAIELTAQWAKTSDIVGVGSESDAWFSEQAVNRFVQIEFTSTAVAETGSPDVPYSWLIQFPMRYYTRQDTNSSGNTTVTLVGRAYYDGSLGYTLHTEVTNTLATASL
jgi:hypothetical protein